jgi:hypothetical protein
MIFVRKQHINKFPVSSIVFYSKDNNFYLIHVHNFFRLKKDLKGSDLLPLASEIVIK